MRHRVHDTTPEQDAQAEANKAEAAANIAEHDARVQQDLTRQRAEADQATDDTPPAVQPADQGKGTGN